MKTKFLFASAMVLFMASCSQEFDEIGQTPNVGVDKGITFATSINEGASTRADLEGTTDADGNTVFNVNWFADYDKIGVFYKKGSYVKDLAGNKSLEAKASGWMGKKGTSSAVNSFVFRASASGTTGYFVANSQNDILKLTEPDSPYDKDKTPTFRAYWPYETTVKNFSSNTKITLPNLSAQTQTSASGYGIVDKYSFMVSEATSDAEYDANDNSVSKDRFSLKFKRVNPIMYFKVKATSEADETLNREYKRDYADKLFDNLGGLKSIKLETEGSQKTGTTLTAPSNLTFNSDASWDIAAENVYDRSKAFSAGTANDAASEITTTISGVNWTNDAVAFMAIANVDRSAYKKAGEKEKVTATYTFGSVALEKSIETDKNWDVNEKNWYGFPSAKGYSLDEEPYIAYEYGSGTGVYALEVNSSFTGDLADLFNDSEELIGITKNGGSAIAKSEIKHFISKKDITATADFTVIKSLTGLTHVTLLANTTIPAEAFKGLTSLVYLNLPQVTTVANVNAFPANQYTDVYMGSYDFSDKNGTNQTVVREALLQKTYLVRADISAVANINAGFPTSGITFNGFLALKEVTVKNGAVIGSTAFKDCAVLTKVQFPKAVTNGAVTLSEGANSQFMGCEDLTDIAINNTVIPDLAFSGCTTLANITDGEGDAIVPTTIGISSFEGCKALKDIDLSKTTSMGNAAFKDCTTLEGNNDVNEFRTVLYVNAITHVPDDAFNGCNALQYISFANATTIGVDILKGTTCTEIEFLKPFTVNSSKAMTNTTFGTVTNTKLFCAKDQTGVTVNTLTLKGVSIEFSNITKYDK